MTDTDVYARALVKALGAEIRSWRRTRELTRHELAQQAGISETTVGRIERDGPVDVGDTWSIARALGIPLADLVRRAEEAVHLAGRTSLSEGADTPEHLAAAHEEEGSVSGEQEQSETP